MAESNLGDIISASLKSIKEFAGTDTIVGAPITLPNGKAVIPISKILMGFASGGMDNHKKHEGSPKPKSFTGGGGTGVSILPIAFLVSSPTGKVELLPITSPKHLDTVDKIASLIERSPDIIHDLKNALTPEKKKEERLKKAFGNE